MHRKHNVFIGIIVLALLCICCGCTNNKTIVDENYIEAELQERYGKEFVCDSLNYTQHMCKAICHPIDDASLKFQCMYGEDGSFGYDYYVGAIIAREESECFSNYIGDGLGESYIRCAYALIIHDDISGYVDSNLDICELIKRDSFTIKKAYDIYPIDRLFFEIYIDNQIGDRDYGKEYEIIEDAVEKIASKYNDLYGLDIYIDMDIYFLDDIYYQQLIVEYDDSNDDLSELLNHSTNIRMQMGNPKDYVTKDLWLSREEYICAREAMEL